MMGGSPVSARPLVSGPVKLANQTVSVTLAAAAITMRKTVTKIRLILATGTTSILRAITKRLLIIATATISTLRVITKLILTIATTTASALLATPLTILVSATSAANVAMVVSKTVSAVAALLTSLISYPFKFFYDAEVMYSIPSEHQDLLIHIDNREMVVPADSDPAERNFEDSEMDTINRRRP